MLDVVGGAGLVKFGGNEEWALLASGENVDSDWVVLGGACRVVLAPGNC